MKIQVKQFAKKKIEALVKKDMQEWPPFNFDSVKWIMLLHQQSMLRPTLVVWKERFEFPPTKLRKYLESIITNEQLFSQP